MYPGGHEGHPDSEKNFKYNKVYFKLPIFICLFVNPKLLQNQIVLNVHFIYLLKFTYSRHRTESVISMSGLLLLQVTAIRPPPRKVLRSILEDTK